MLFAEGGNRPEADVRNRLILARKVLKHQDESTDILNGEHMRTFISVLLMGISTFAVAGYDLHISRKVFWGDDFGPEITFEEWQEHLKIDPQVVRDVANSPQDFMVSIPGESFPLWYRSDLGELFTKNPTDKAITKLEEIARSLNARVQGDDGEFYPEEP